VEAVAKMLGLSPDTSKHVRFDGIAPRYSPEAVGLIVRELRSRGEVSHG
jgi:hypothetical protein